MSGSYISTGLLTNNGLNQLSIDKYLNKNIKGLTIHVIPLFTNKIFLNTQIILRFLKFFVPLIYNPSLSHIAIQLDLENSEDVLIIEYGQYLTEDYLNKNYISNSSGSSNNLKRENKNENIYYYINKDGARITIFTAEYLKKFESYISDFVISRLIACQYYKISYEDYKNFLSKKFFGELNFVKVTCEVINRITIKELIYHFKEEKWEAKNYIINYHDCQSFASEIIKILKAVRKNEEDKIRCIEKVELPDCIIRSLWKNEPLSLLNTLGRIPIFGFFHDLYKSFKY